MKPATYSVSFELLQEDSNINFVKSLLEVEIYYIDFEKAIERAQNTVQVSGKLSETAPATSKPMLGVIEQVRGLEVVNEL